MTPIRPKDRDAVLQRKRPEVHAQEHLARAADVPGVGRDSVGEVDHRVDARLAQRATLLQSWPRVARAPKCRFGVRRALGAPLDHRQPRALVWMPVQDRRTRGCRWGRRGRSPLDCLLLGGRAGKPSPSGQIAFPTGAAYRR